MEEAGPATMTSRAKVKESIEGGIQKGRGAGRVRRGIWRDLPQ